MSGGSVNAQCQKKVPLNRADAHPPYRQRHAQTESHALGAHALKARLIARGDVEGEPRALRTGAPSDRLSIFGVRVCGRC